MSSSRSKAVFQAQEAGGLRVPRVGTVGTIPAQREPDRRNFLFGHRSVDELQPVGLARNRSRVKGGPVGIMPEARASPVPARAPRTRLATGSAPRSGRQSISSRPAGWGCSESPLPDVAAVPVVPEIPAHVRGQQPVHPAAQLAVGTGPNHQMEVVGQQAVGHYPHRHADARLTHDPDESRHVLLLVEQFGPRIASVDHVIAVSTGRRSGRSRYGGTPM